MSIKFKVRQGGASASQPDLANLAEAREGVPVFDSSGFPLIDMAQRWEMGQAGQGSYTYVDVDGSLSYFHRPHAEVKLIEDESGTDYVIGWGRMEGGNDVARPTASGSGGPGHGTVEHNSIQVMDCNIDLRGLPFRTAWERPAETTWQRLQALELRSLNGSSSTGQTRRATTDITINNFTGGNHLVDASDPVDMEAHTYPVGTTPLDVMEDIFSQWEGKRWGVTIHHTDSGSHKCLLVLDPDDNETFQSALKISDHLEDWNPDDPDEPVLAPEWRRGAGKISDNSDVISGLISIYGGNVDNPRHVYVETADSEDEWETWVDVYNDDIAKNETQAERRANKILADRKRPYVTPQPSIRLNPDQVTLITAGQSIEVKSVVINQGADRANYQWWRIAEIRWEPLPDGRWLAHLELGRAKNARGANGGGGPPQPGSTSPKPPPICIPDPGDTEQIDWDWEPCASVSWEDSFTLLTGNAWGSYPGWTGSPGCGTSAARAYSSHWAVAEGDVITVTITAARYGGAGGSWPATLAMRFIDASGDVLQDQGRTINLGGLSLEGGAHGNWETTVVTFDAAPADTAHVQLKQVTWSTCVVQHVTATVAASPPDNDEFCVPEGTYDPEDPFYAPSGHNHDDDYADVDHTHTPQTIFTSWKAPVRVATTANGTLATAFDAGSTVDGITLAESDRILIKDQTSKDENGIYLVQASGAPIRDYDMDDSGDFIAGAMVRVMEGSTQEDTVWGVTTDDPIVLDTDDIEWAQLSGGGGSVATDAIWDAKGDLAAGTGANTAAKLTVGSNDTILMADSGQSTGLKWVAPATPATVGTANSAGTSDDFTRGDHVHAHEAAHINHDTTWAAKGDLIVATGNDAASILTVGSNNKVLAADSAETTGLKWVEVGDVPTGDIVQLYSGAGSIRIPGLGGDPRKNGLGGGGITEEYETGTTGLTWSPTTPGTINSNSTVPSHLYLEWTGSGSTETLGLRSWSPGSGAFDARMHMAYHKANDANTNAAGLIITDSGNSNRLLIQSSKTRTTCDVSAFTYASSTYTGRGNSFTVPAGQAIYLRIVRDGSNNCTFYWSGNGMVWCPIAVQAFTLTVANIGFRLSENNTSTTYVVSDFLRTNV